MFWSLVAWGLLARPLLQLPWEAGWPDLVLLEVGVLEAAGPPPGLGSVAWEVLAPHTLTVFLPDPPSGCLGY